MEVEELVMQKLEKIINSGFDIYTISDAFDKAQKIIEEKKFNLLNEFGGVKRKPLNKKEKKDLNKKKKQEKKDKKLQPLYDDDDDDSIDEHFYVNVDVDITLPPLEPKPPVELPSYTIQNPYYQNIDNKKYAEHQKQSSLLLLKDILADDSSSSSSKEELPLPIITISTIPYLKQKCKHSPQRVLTKNDFFKDNNDSDIDDFISLRVEMEELFNGVNVDIHYEYHNNFVDLRMFGYDMQKGTNPKPLTRRLKRATKFIEFKYQVSY